MTSLDNIKQDLAELTVKRNRNSQDPLTWKERLEVLNRCYDGTLYWLEQMVIAGTTKGTGGATTILERCRLEINEIQRARQNKAARRKQGSRDAMEASLLRVIKDEPNQTVRLQAMRDLAKLKGWVVDKYQGSVEIDDAREHYRKILETPGIGKQIKELENKILDAAQENEKSDK